MSFRTSNTEAKTAKAHIQWKMANKYNYSQAIWWKNCSLWDESTTFGMVIVLGLLNNISFGPQTGGTFCTQRGRVVAVSNLTAVIEKKAAISIGNGVLGKFNKVYLIQLSRWSGRGERFQHSLYNYTVK